AVTALQPRPVSDELKGCPAIHRRLRPSRTWAPRGVRPVLARAVLQVRPLAALPGVRPDPPQAAWSPSALYYWSSLTGRPIGDRDGQVPVGGHDPCRREEEGCPRG